ncbi:DegT/DnrJ/EryC1/StrS family aminotransferase [Ekhidna sp.]|uniref:DegT/DnrJ/EryC1/StrS family aminotransferase n=1 Tax=Ekhidna sp. TaxID=2608089 RepID=UPI00351911EF
MSVPFTDLKAQYLSIKDEIDEAVFSVINQGSYIQGDIVHQFESNFADYLGAKRCIGVANGTDALEIALKSLGIGIGDEVIVPALSWMSTAGAVSNVGAKPVFVDVLESEKTIDPDGIEIKISNKTKAIIPVHLYGLPARMTDILAIAKKHNLKVVEDCAQAHGAEIDGKRVGTFGDVSAFSFYPTKNLGAYGDAGGIITNDNGIAQTCRMISNYGQMSKHDHQVVGRNSRLDSLQAAILKAKLPHLEKWIDARQQVAAWYADKLSGVVLPIIPQDLRHAFHLFVIQSKDRTSLIKKFDKAEIGYGIHYPTPLPFQKCYADQNHKLGDFPIAEKLCNEVISLPIYPEMKEEWVGRVCEVLNNSTSDE